MAKKTRKKAEPQNLHTSVIAPPTLANRKAATEYLAGDFAGWLHAACDLTNAGAYLEPMLLCDLAHIADTLAWCIENDSPVSFSSEAMNYVSELARSVTELERKLEAGEISFSTKQGPAELYESTLPLLGDALVAASQQFAEETRSRWDDAMVYRRKQREAGWPDEAREERERQSRKAESA